jgi:hypothetical protein
MYFKEDFEYAFFLPSPRTSQCVNWYIPDHDVKCGSQAFGYVKLNRGVKTKELILGKFSNV